MNQYKAKALAEGAICSVLSLVLVLIGIYIPSLSFLMTMLAGVPMIYLGMRRGFWVLVLSLAAAVIIMAVITGDWKASLLTGIMSFLPGVVIGRTLRERQSFAAIVFSGAAVILFGLVLQLVLLNAMGGGQGIADMVNQALDVVRQSMGEVLVSLEGQLPDQGQELQAAINQAVDLVRDTIFLYLPSFLIGTSVVMSYLLFMLGIFLLHRIRPVRIIYQPFWGFCAPRSMCYLAAVLFMVTSLSADSTVWTAALKNIVLLLYAYFAVCGISFIDYKFRKKISSGFARGAIYFAALCVGYLILGMLFQGLCVLGMLDGVFGFRIREERVGHE